MELLRRLGKFIDGESVSGIRIERVYDQALKYHQELLQVFAPGSNLLPPRLVMFWPFTSARELEAMPDELTAAEASELAVFINTVQFMGEAFYAPQYNTLFIKRTSLTSQSVLDHTLSEEIGHRIVQLPDDGIPLTIEVMETLNGPMPDFGKKMVDNLKAKPPFERMVTRSWMDPYLLAMNEFFPPLFLIYLTGEDYPVTPDFFIEKRIDESHMGHLPLLAGRMLVTQYRGDVKAILNEHPQLTKVNSQQFWNQYCLPILTTGKI